MLFVIRFTDAANSQAIRAAHVNDHLAWLDAHADCVLVAGVIRSEAEGPVSAALWIVRADSPQAALQLTETDPFWVHGLRATREVYFYKAHSAISEFN